MKKGTFFRPKRKKRFVCNRALSLFFSFLFAAAVYSDVIVQWEFDDLSQLPGGTNNFGPSPFAPADKSSFVDVVGLTRGMGVTTSGTGAQKAWGGNGLNVGNTTAALDNHDYVYFSITANEGYYLSLTQIDAYNIRRSATGPTRGQWQYQVGSGEFVNIGTEIIWGNVTSSAGNPQSAIDLSGISALQNVSGGTIITIRLLIWDGSNPNGTWYFNGANTLPLPLTLNGSICEILPSLSFVAPSIEKVEGDAPFTQVATSNSLGAISYSSDNPSIASVNSTTGEVTLGTIRGIATITATQEASGIYCAATATYDVEYSCATVTLSGTTNICKNATTILTPNITGGVWQSENTAIGTVVDGFVTGKDSGMVNITYTTPAGCPANKYITIFPLPDTSEITHQ
jgi:hypothetical protein